MIRPGPPALYFIIDSLKRQGIIEEQKGVTDENVIMVREEASDSYYMITELGERFIAACQAPKEHKE